MRKHGLPGKFIVIDGREGVGKSTQIARLKEQLPRLFPDRERVFTHEPGGTPFADKIYALFKQTMTETDPQTQFSLVFASRSDHVKKVVLPALARGAIIICDRFESSTYAYQVFKSGKEDLNAIFYCYQQLVPPPDLTCILEVPTEVVLERLAARKGQEMSAFDQGTREFHDRLAEGFRWYARFYSGHPVAFVNGNRPEGEVFAELLRHITAAIA